MYRLIVESKLNTQNMKVYLNNYENEQKLSKTSLYIEFFETEAIFQSVIENYMYEIIIL